MDTPKKFPLGKVRELHKHVKGLHEHLTGLLAGYDNAEDDLQPQPNRAAKDDSDASEPYAQGQDASVVVAAVRAAIVAERDAPVPMDKAIPGLGRDISHC